jgi:hypothetical protein
MSLADIEAELPDMSGELPADLPWVMQWANVGLRERSTMHSTSTAYLAVGARCLVGGHGAGSPMQVFISPDDDRQHRWVCALDARR